MSTYLKQGYAFNPKDGDRETLVWMCPECNVGGEIPEAKKFVSPINEIDRRHRELNPDCPNGMR